jgi:glycosyltransferase involved in cell wall biosynthesis
MKNNFVEKIVRGIDSMSEDISEILEFSLSDEQFVKNLVKTVEKDIYISFVLMTYNEERVIERCLKSIQDLADEIIIVDTGSTDSTIEIINNFNGTIQLYKQKFENDFAAIRNTLFSYAKYNWVFQIDADEYLQISKEQLIIYIALLENIDIQPKIISPKLTNHDGSIVDNTRRLCKKDINLKYYGRVHEELRYLGSARTPFFIINSHFYHDGYQQEIIKKKKKYLRNIALTELMIVEEENNPRWYYFLAREKMYNKDSYQTIVPLLNKGLMLSQINDMAYCWGLIELYSKVPTIFIDFALIYSSLRYVKERTPECLDSYYYELFFKSVEIKQELFEENGRNLEAIMNLEGGISFINKEGDHMFWLLGWNYLACRRDDLATIMWKKMKTQESISSLHAVLDAIKDEVCSCESRGDEGDI